MPGPLCILSRATPADIPRLAAISARAFARDTNTQMKAQGQKPGAFEEGMAAGLRMWVDLPPSRCVVLKAIERRDDGGSGGGHIAGWVCWGTRGAELTLPSSPEPDGPTLLHEPTTAAGTSEHGDEEEAELASEKRQDEEQVGAGPSEEAVSRIKQFEDMTSEHLAAFQKKIMPEGTRCMYIISAAVDPAAQGRGVGSRLVRWGTEQADRNGVFCWVHASEAGWKMFEGQGFVEVERLTVDLDAWAVGRKTQKGKLPLPSSGDEEEGKGIEESWGEYTFRYMVRKPGAI